MSVAQSLAAFFQRVFLPNRQSRQESGDRKNRADPTAAAGERRRDERAGAEAKEEAARVASPLRRQSRLEVRE